MQLREHPVREHTRPDEEYLRGSGDGRSERPLVSRPSPNVRRYVAWVISLAVPLLSLFIVALLLAGCEIGVALGLPRNDECRDVETSPGDPISKECLDTIGKTPSSP